MVNKEIRARKALDAERSDAASRAKKKAEKESVREEARRAKKAEESTKLSEQLRLQLEGLVGDLDAAEREAFGKAFTAAPPFASAAGGAWCRAFLAEHCDDDLGERELDLLLGRPEGLDLEEFLRLLRDHAASDASAVASFQEVANGEDFLPAQESRARLAGLVQRRLLGGDAELDLSMERWGYVLEAAMRGADAVVELEHWVVYYRRLTRMVRLMLFLGLARAVEKKTRREAERRGEELTMKLFGKTKTPDPEEEEEEEDGEGAADEDDEDEADELLALAQAALLQDGADGDARVRALRQEVLLAVEAGLGEDQMFPLFEDLYSAGNARRAATGSAMPLGTCRELLVQLGATTVPSLPAERWGRVVAEVTAEAEEEDPVQGECLVQPAQWIKYCRRLMKLARKMRSKMPTAGGGGAAAAAGGSSTSCGSSAASSSAAGSGASAASGAGTDRSLGPVEPEARDRGARQSGVPTGRRRGGGRGRGRGQGVDEDEEDEARPPSSAEPALGRPAAARATKAEACPPSSAEPAPARPAAARAQKDDPAGAARRNLEKAVRARDSGKLEEAILAAASAGLDEDELLAAFELMEALAAAP